LALAVIMLFFSNRLGPMYAEAGVAGLNEALASQVGENAMPKENVLASLYRHQSGSRSPSNSPAKTVADGSLLAFAEAGAEPLFAAESDMEQAANVLVNGSFEAGAGPVADGWVPIVAAGAQGTYAVVNSPVVSGNQAQQVSGSDIPAGGVVMVHQMIEVDGDKPFQVSGQFKVEALSNAVVQLHVDFSTAEDSYLGSVVQTQDTLTEGYVKLSGSGQTPAGAKHARVYAILRAIGENGAGSFVVDDMQFVQGVVADTTAPSVPVNLKATGKTSTQVSLQWDASTDETGVSGYELYKGTELAATVTSTVYAVVEGLQPGTSYHFTVKAKDSAGNVSAASEPLEVATDGANVLVNGGFEEGMGTVANGWVPIVALGAEGTFAVVDSGVASGSQAQQVSGTGIPTGGVAMVHQMIEVDGDKPFQVSGQFKIEALSNAVVQLHVDFSTAEDSYLGSVVQTQDTLTEGYVKLSGSGQTPVGAKHARVYAILRATGENGAGSFVVDDMSFVQGIVADTTAPSVPVNMKVVGKTSTQVSLQWDASTDETGVSGYELYKGTELAATVTSTVYTVEGLQPGTNYHFTVKAKDSAGNVSAASEPVEVTTDGANVLVNGGFEEGMGSVANGWVPIVAMGAEGTFVVVNSPVASGSQAQQVSGTGIPTGGVVMVHQMIEVDGDKPFQVSGQFKVEALNNAVVQLHVDFSTADDSYLGSVVQTQDTLTEDYVKLNGSGQTPVGAKHARVYAILRATGENGAGSFVVDDMSFVQGIAADITAPSVPVNLKAIGKTSTQVSLQWDTSTDETGVSGYELYKGTELAATVTSTVYTVEGLQPGTSYHFTVKAKDNAGNMSAASEPLEVTTDGANVLVNGGFEEGTGAVANGWVPIVAVGAEGIFAVVNSPVASGSQAQQVSGAGIPTGGVAMVHQMIEVDGDKPFQVSGQFKVEALNNAVVQLHVDFSTAEDSYLGSVVQTQDTLTEDYVKLSGSGQIPAGAKHARVYAILRATGENGAGSFVVDEMSFVQGIDSASGIPAAPTNLVVAQQTANTVTLHWVPSVQGAYTIQGYNIYQDGQLAGFTAASQFTVMALASGGTYHFTVKAVAVDGMLSGASNVVTASLNAVPTVQLTNLFADKQKVLVTANMLPKVKWQQHSDEAGAIFSQYEIQMTDRDNQVVFSFLSTDQPTTAVAGSWTSGMDTSLDNIPTGQYLQVKVRVMANGQWSDWSEPGWLIIGTGKITYSYDQLNRLSTVTFESGLVVTYTYDAGGNILSVSTNQP